MPTYVFMDQETQEVSEHFMKISELDEFIANNPHLRQVPTAPAIVDPVSIGVKKPPSDFSKYVLGRIKEKAPGVNKAALEKRWTIPKEI